MDQWTGEDWGRVHSTKLLLRHTTSSVNCKCPLMDSVIPFARVLFNNKCVIISVGCSEQVSKSSRMSYCSTHFTGLLRDEYSTSYESSLFSIKHIDFVLIIVSVCQKTKHSYTQQMNCTFSLFFLYIQFWLFLYIALLGWGFDWLIICSYERCWFYHKELRLWFFRVGEPLVRTAAYERGTYECLDPNSFKTVRKVSRKYVFLDIWI